MGLRRYESCPHDSSTRNAPISHSTSSSPQVSSCTDDGDWYIFSEGNTIIEYMRGNMDRQTEFYHRSSMTWTKRRRTRFEAGSTTYRGTAIALCYELQLVSVSTTSPTLVDCHLLE